MPRNADFSDDELLDLLENGIAPRLKRTIAPSVEKADFMLAHLTSVTEDSDMGNQVRACGGMNRVSISPSSDSGVEPYYATENGLLFEGDCLDHLAKFRSNLVDTIFADPPFNLGNPTAPGQTIRARITSMFNGASAGWPSASGYWRQGVLSSFIISRNGASF